VCMCTACHWCLEWRSNAWAVGMAAGGKGHEREPAGAEPRQPMRDHGQDGDGAPRKPMNGEPRRNEGRRPTRNQVGDITALAAPDEASRRAANNRRPRPPKPVRMRERVDQAASQIQGSPASNRIQASVASSDAHNEPRLKDGHSHAAASPNDQSAGGQGQGGEKPKRRRPRHDRKRGPENAAKG
jgi:hypothetical protein